MSINARSDDDKFSSVCRKMANTDEKMARMLNLLTAMQKEVRKVKDNDELTKEIAKFNKTFSVLCACINDALLHYKGK